MSCKKMRILEKSTTSVSLIKLIRNSLNRTQTYEKEKLNERKTSERINNIVLSVPFHSVHC